jgi:uncharacterized protein
MRFHLINRQKSNRMRKFANITVSLLASLLISSSWIVSGQSLPEKPNPPRLVNDFAGLLSSQEANALENKLVLFNDSSSTQIAIVIVNDLNGYVIEEYAQRIGEKWGVGQKGKNNGLVIVVKTRSASGKGEVFIKPAYGLEGAVPDLICSQIVDDEVLPAFRQEDYYKGLDKATNTIISLVRGEYTADQYAKKPKKAVKKAAPFGGIAFIIFIVILLISSGRNNHNGIGRRGGSLPFWLLLSMMNSGRGSGSGSWGGFSGGGGSGGGFGGFGGGSFGGGGAGGSW